MSDNYLVAICDILGFKNLILNNNVEEVVNNSLAYLKRSIYHSITQKEIPDKIPTMNEIKQESKVGFAIFSDTILLYTKKDTDDDCQFLLETCGWLLFENVFNHSTRLRIGVSYGESFINEEDNIYIGKPIVDAYQLEKSQEWSGGALTKNAEERIPEFVKTENESAFNWYLTYYNVPLKNGLNEKLLTIDWSRGIHHYLPFEWSNSHKEPTDDEILKIPDIVSKWRNTKKYHGDNCVYCRKIKSADLI